MPSEDSTFQLAKLSVGSREGEGEKVPSLKRKLENMGKEKNDLKEKVDSLSPDFIQKENCGKTLAHYVE